MLTEKPVTASTSTNASATDIVRQIATLEKKYQEDLNKAFTSLSEGSFKSLRRQLPVTRQKVDWDKVGGYRVSSTRDEILGAILLTMPSWVRISEEAGSGDHES